MSAPVATAAAGASRSGGVADYLELIQRYRREPDRDRAVAELVSWDPGAVRRVVQEVELRASPLELRAATLLHGDAGMLAYRRGDGGLGEFHLERGLRLLGRARGDANALLWPHRWLLAIGIFHASGATPGDAIPFLKRALEVFPDDPQLLLVLGQVEENFATRGVRGWAPRKKRRDRRRDARYVMHGGSSGRSGLRDAEAHYLLALAANPELHEARLHLGRIRQVRGEVTRARESLEEVLAARPGAYLVYVANLLLGGLDEAAGDLVSAAARYRAAVATDRGSQVAVLALAHVTHRMGRRGESADMVERLLSRRVRRSRQPDGWWRFRMGPLGDRHLVEGILAGLREEVTE